MTLSLINFEQRFRVCWWSYQNLLSIVFFYFRIVKLHYVEEIHIMLVPFGVENCCSISAQEITKESERNLHQDLLTIENVDSGES